MIGRLMGIDHGLSRIGIAISDASGIVARELTIIRRASKAEEKAAARGAKMRPRRAGKEIQLELIPLQENGEDV